MSSNKYSSLPLRELLVDFPAFPRQLSSSSTSDAKKLSFLDDPQVHHHRYSIENYCEIPYSSWYDRNDYSNFRRSTRTDVKALRHVLARNDDLPETLETSHGITAVGIVHLASSEIASRVVEHRNAHRNAVLNEYRRQVRDCKMDPELLRYISSKFSKRSKVTAVGITRNIL
mmetsp:Transcript_3194/g.6408  ORF Transcript_3194/g.6408 Transcript_3194/m.6408 type:complete len:172 (+) Transcript_3194:137-652(+)